MVQYKIQQRNVEYSICCMEVDQDADEPRPEAIDLRCHRGDYCVLYLKRIHKHDSSDQYTGR